MAQLEQEAWSEPTLDEGEEAREPIVRRAHPSPRRVAYRVGLSWAAHLLVVASLTVMLYQAAGPAFDAFDEGALRWLYLHYAEPAATWARRVSLLGHPYVAIPSLLCGLSFVYTFAGSRAAAFVFVVYFFAGADYLILVDLFGRARPHLFEELPPPAGFGTPSGHSTATMALYGSIALLTWSRLGRKGLWLAVPLVATFLAVGFTRSYLQVHYPTDVLLAWIMTGTWAVLAYVAIFGTWPGAPLARPASSAGGAARDGVREGARRRNAD